MSTQQIKTKTQIVDLFWKVNLNAYHKESIKTERKKFRTNGHFQNEKRISLNQ